MKFKQTLNEVFANKEVEEKDYYKDNSKRKKDAPEEYLPHIVKNGLSDLNIDGTIKQRKKK